MAAEQASNRSRVISPDVLRGEPRERTPPGQSLTQKWPVLHYGYHMHGNPWTEERFGW